jgi:hypothetical protein
MDKTISRLAKRDEQAFALRKSLVAHVSNGSKTVLTPQKRDFCITPDSVAKVESCNGPIFSRKSEAQRGR